MIPPSSYGRAALASYAGVSLETHKTRGSRPCSRGAEVNCPRHESSPAPYWREDRAPRGV